MSSHQTNKDKPRASKCRHFCFSFDIHNYCPTCREAEKLGDDPCVTFEAPCDICASFTDEQINKIQYRKQYIKKQKKGASSSKDDELDLLGEGDGDSFTGSNADLESAADNLFTVPRSKQAPLDHRWLQDGHCLHFGPSGAPYCTKFKPSQVILQFPQGSSQKFQESSKMEPFFCSQ